MGLEALLSSQIIGLAETIDDEVASLLIAGTGITLTYNDGAGTLTIAASSTGIGGSTGSTDNAVLRADGTGGATLQNSAFVIADIATASPNNTVNHASIQATGATANVSVSIVPKGSGAVMLAVPDGTATGGNIRGSNAIDLQVSRTTATQVASGDNSVAIGNRNTAGSMGVSIGFSNTSGTQGIAIGRDSTANGTASIAIGNELTSAGNSSAIAIGTGVSTTTYACGAFGRSALATHPSKFAEAWGSFAVAGDMQFYRAILANKTTNNTPTVLACRTVFSTTDRPVVGSGTVMTFIAQIVGVKSDGSAVAFYVRKGAIKRVGSTTSLVGAIETIGTDHEDNPVTDVSIAADDTNESLQVTVTGVSGETWRWEAVIEGVQLGYGT
jgi:hypothetical protein